MSRHRARHASVRHTGRHTRACTGPLRRLIRGIAARLGVPRSWVIGGFVLGFVFTPLLALLVLVAAWLWLDHPVRVRAQFERIRRLARRIWWGWADPLPAETTGPPPSGTRSSARSGSGAGPGGGARAGVEEELAELRRRLERAGQRVEAMERYVTSEDRTLHQAFREI